MKKIWFVSHYSMPPEYEMRIKTQMFSYYLNKEGFETLIFSASTIHNSNINLICTNDRYIERKYNSLKFVHIKCSNYSGNGLKRLKNMLEFPLKFFFVAKKFSLPNAIIADVNCINYFPIYLFCKYNKIPFFIDLRDLWPLSIVEFYKFSEKNLIIKLLYIIEKLMYKQATGVIFTMPGGLKYIKEKNWKNIDYSKFHYINNGVDIEIFNQQIAENSYCDSDLDSPISFKVIYVGSIRKANNISSLIEAAEILKFNNNIQILIYGAGEEVNELKLLCKNKDLDNIKFKGFLDKKYIPYVLNKGDLSILSLKSSKTLKYGFSQNKLFEYLAAGKPILLTFDMDYNIVQDYKCGISLKNQTPHDIANGILHIYNLSAEERITMGENAKKLAKEYDFKILTDKLINILQIK